MNWKPFILGAAVGLIGGYTVREIISQKENVSPEKVLEHVRKQFKQQGEISGSWIYIHAEPFTKAQITYQVYKGGISRHENGEQKQYEFIADSSTGTIIDIYPVTV